MHKEIAQAQHFQYLFTIFIINITYSKQLKNRQNNNLFVVVRDILLSNICRNSILKFSQTIRQLEAIRFPPNTCAQKG